jgi:ferredoxin
MNDLKKITIFYFTGTGNAKQIALWFSELGVRRGLECKMFNIVTTDLKNIEEFDIGTLIIIISPIHGFNFPKITLDFIEQFPKGKNRIVLMNTRGGMKIGSLVTPGLTGVAFFLSSLILKIKGYHIVGQIPFDMPSNWISLHPALNENTIKFLFRKNYSRVEKYAEKLYSGKSYFLSNRDLIQDILISPVSVAYYLIGKYALAKTFYAGNRCNNCGLCVRQCPVKAIKIANGRPFWTLKCESCMRCMNSCPENTIETAHGLIISVSFLSSLLFSFLITSSGMLFFKSEPLNTITVSVLFIVLMCLSYRIQHLFLKNKSFTRLVSFTSLTHYKFWGRYKPLTDDISRSGG